MERLGFSHFLAVTSLLSGLHSLESNLGSRLIIVDTVNHELGGLIRKRVDILSLLEVTGEVSELYSCAPLQVVDRTQREGRSTGIGGGVSCGVGEGDEKLWDVETEAFLVTL